jgi:hypothetical protein
MLRSKETELSKARAKLISKKLGKEIMKKSQIGSDEEETVSVKPEKPQYGLTREETRILQFKALFSEGRSLQRKRLYE